jgi:hypothetical protein
MKNFYQIKFRLEHEKFFVLQNSSYKKLFIAQENRILDSTAPPRVGFLIGAILPVIDLAALI